MITVTYDLEFNYRPLTFDDNSPNAPVLPVTLIGPSGEHDVLGLVDSGARGCLFKGELARQIGISNIMDGRMEKVYGLGGGEITAYFHDIQMQVDAASFSLEAGFTMDQISYNILGGTFLDKIQLGLREHHGRFYISFSP